MTLKAVRLIRENKIIAVPGADPKETVAYKIAVQAVPELAEKKLLPIYMPMTHDSEELEKNHAKGAKALEEILDQEENIVFLTLGDPVYTLLLHTCRSAWKKTGTIQSLSAESHLSVLRRHA